VGLDCVQAHNDSRPDGICPMVEIQGHQETELTIMWKKPEFTEMRFGFEVTMYIYNR
jgi:coenzyme PQQ precursor peptide PqqA